MKPVSRELPTSRSSVGLMALEQRLLFDGAGAVAAGGEVPGAGSDATREAATFSAVRVEPTAQLKEAARLDLVEKTASPPAPSVDGAPDEARTCAGQTLVFDHIGPGEPPVGQAPRVSIADADGSSVPGHYRLLITANHGDVSVGEGSASVSGNSGRALELTGSLQQINAALEHLRYEPTAGFAGVGSITFGIIAPDCLENWDTMRVVVDGSNQAPHANDDVRTVAAGSGPVRGNLVHAGADGDVADTDPDGDPLEVRGVTDDPSAYPDGNVGQVLQGRHGSLVVHSDGSYEYLPDPGAPPLADGEVREDVFGYRISDPCGESSCATLTIRIVGQGEPEPPGTDPAPEPVPPEVPTPTDPAPPETPPSDPPPPETPPEVVPPETPIPPDPGLPGLPTPVPPIVPGPGLPVPVPAPPVMDAPPTGAGPVPLPPVTTVSRAEPAPAPGAPDPSDGRSPDGPYGRLAERSAGPPDLPPDAFSPYAPLAVLGLIETAPDLERARKAAAAPVAGSDDCVPAPPPKPKAVKRGIVGGPGLVEPRNPAFSEQVDQAKQKIKPPVAPRLVKGRQC